MASYNRVLLIGNLTRDPELRYLPSNLAVCSFGLAVNDRWKDKNTGEWQERANFIDCECFGRGGEIINQYMTKGRPLFVEGKLRLDQWDDKQSGQKRSKLKVVVENFQFLGGRDEQGGPGPGSGGAQGGRSQQGGGRGRPQNQPPAYDDDGPPPSAYDGPQHEPVSEGDIPF
jgi:single-strand DNA-binding protein